MTDHNELPEMEVQALNSMTSIRREIIKYFQLSRKDIGELQIEVTKMEILLKTRWFILSAFKYKGETKNVVTFEVGVSPGAIADLTRIISKYVPPTELSVGKSHYRNPDTDELTFGEEAYHAKEEEYAKVNGRKPCFICENFTDINKLNKNGLCPICLAMKVEDQIVWN